MKTCDKTHQHKLDCKLCRCVFPVGRQFLRLFFIWFKKKKEKKKKREKLTNKKKNFSIYDDVLLTQLVLY